MSQFSATAHALIKDAILRAAASWRAAPEDDRLTRLETIVSELQRLVADALPGADGSLDPSGLSGPPGLPGGFTASTFHIKIVSWRPKSVSNASVVSGSLRVWST